MELVYLWVKNYKNIQKQGFNFSPRFRCEYDEDTKELKVVDKDETGEFYPKNFFGDNINVTAIVGENGSGKSSIFKQINELLLNSYYSTGLILIIYENNSIKILNLSKIKINFDYCHLLKKEIIKSTKEFLNGKIFYYTSSIFDKNSYLRNKDKMSYYGFLEDYDLISQKSIINRSIKNIIFLYKNLDEKYFKELNLNLSKEIEFYPKLSTIEKMKKISYTLVKSEEVYKFFSKKTNIKKNRNEKDFLLVHFWLTLFEEFEQFDPEFINFFHITEFSEENFIEKIEKYFSDEAPFLMKFINKFIQISNKELINTRKDGIRLNLFRYFWINISDCDEEFLELFDKIDILEIFDLNWIVDLQIRNMSSGEMLILDLLAKIYKYIRENKDINTLFLFDEIEALLHPEWQRKYLNLINKIILLFSENEKHHLMFATHSPFILSDLPKQNVIFLEKGKQVYPFDDGKQTFGANIHTLLSHGFFMKDGLMGEFAKDKIDDVIKYLNNDKKSTITTDKDAQNIIDIIGEPIIKRELQRMLKNKMELSNKTEIDTIKDEIKLLTERLEKLEPKDEK